MSIISQETWNKFTDKEKKSVIERFKDNKSHVNISVADLVTSEFEALFGKENLQPKAIVKTWNDVILTADEKNVFDNYVIVRNVVHCPEALRKRLEATYRIGKIIELGYGTISEEEWRNDAKPKLCIVPLATDIGFKVVARFYIDGFELPAFHTTEQVNEFMSYPENVQLLNDYYGAWKQNN